MRGVTSTVTHINTYRIPVMKAKRAYCHAAAGMDCRALLAHVAHIPAVTSVRCIVQQGTYIL